MYKWQPLVLPLASGKTDNQSEVDARAPGISDAENVEFSKTGSALRGRPGYIRKTGFGLRNYSPANTPDADTNEFTLGETSYVGRSLFNYRDRGADRPAILADGRLWTYDTDRWTDRLYCAATRVDRLVNVNIADETQFAYKAVGYNFTAGLAPLLTPDGSIDTWATSSAVIGGSARVTISGVDYYCVAGNVSANVIKLYVRVGYAHELHTYTIALPDIARDPFNLGDAPVICADFDATSLYLAYVTDGDGINILKIDPTDGSVDDSLAVTPTDQPLGIWLTNSTVAANKLVLAIVYSEGVPSAGNSQMDIKIVSMSTLTDLALDTHTVLSGSTPGPVVVGVAEDSRVWWAVIRQEDGKDNYGLTYGYRSTTAATIQALRTYYGSDSPCVNWGIMHQPIKVAGRDILGIWTESGQTEEGNTNGTWMALDLTDNDTAVGGDGVTLFPGLFAMGPQHSTGQPFCPQGAVLDADGGETYRFGSMDYQEFNANGGLKPALGINQVSMLSPQADAFGEETVIGGSVPHLLARGWCSEVGFPWLGAPEIGNLADHSITGINIIPAGSYTLQALWVWTDEAGQVHRSAPSLDFTFDATGADFYTLDVLNYQVTQREYGEVKIELYATDTDPTAIASKFLIATLSQDSGPVTEFTIVGPTFAPGIEDEGDAVMPDTDGLPIYTTGGIYSNLSVSADGGVAALGRRLWLSDGVSAYASKLALPGQAPAWNDEGGLVVTPPSTAGRIVALQAMDDKLIMFCERGIYMTQGEGPDNLGEGSDFLVPFLVSKLGIPGPRAVALADKGVVFQVASSGNTAFDGEEYDGSAGGLWIVDRGLNLQQISGPAQGDLPATPMDLAFSQERQVLYCMTDGALILTWDMRANAWSRWVAPAVESSPVSVAVSNGVLWQLATEPGTYNGSRGYDRNGDLVSQREPYAMMVRTNHIFANGADGFGWARIRSVRVLGEPATHTLMIQALYDQSSNPLSVKTKVHLVDAGAYTVNWPHNRYAPEWRLPVQKCSSLQLTLSAFPANGTWTALELMVQPQTRAPSFQRS